jgi:hypothetical protein
VRYGAADLKDLTVATLDLRPRVNQHLAPANVAAMLRPGAVFLQLRRLPASADGAEGVRGVASRRRREIRL